MKTQKSPPARPDRQPAAAPEKPRRRARIAEIGKAERRAGHHAGSEFLMAFFSRTDERIFENALKAKPGASRPDIRAIGRRGRIILAPFAGEDEKRLEFIATKRRRRLRALLAQEARRRGRYKLGAKFFLRSRAT